jgi:hypothetical protein
LLGYYRPAFTTTVYAFLSPKLPSAAWDFFCLKFVMGALIANVPPPQIGQVPGFWATTDWPNSISV